MNSPSHIRNSLATVVVSIGVLLAPSVHARAPGHAVDAVAVESRLVAQLERLPEQDLKSFYLRCSRAASQHALGSGEIALCSQGYEILLKRIFGGDFFALLAWSQLHSDDTLKTAFRDGTAPSIAVLAPASPPADLEKAFWICDHAATKHGVDGATAIACGVITEDLKVKKFNGDFDSMLAWWRQNKAAEHQALTTASPAVAGR